EEQAAGRNRDHQYQKQSIHGQTSSRITLNSNSLGKTTKGAWRPRATPMRPYLVRTRPSHLPFSVLHYRIGRGLGTGARPQIAGGQVGSGCGVGIRNSLPWVEAEPPDMQVPVKVSRFG